MLYTLTNLLLVGLTLLLGPTVEPAVMTLANEIMKLASGFAMALSYFGGMPELQEKRSVESDDASSRQRLAREVTFPA